MTAQAYRVHNRKLLIANVLVQGVCCAISAALFTSGFMLDPATREMITYIPILTDTVIAVATLVIAVVFCLPNAIASTASFLCAFTKANVVVSTIAFAVCGFGVWCATGAVTLIKPEIHTTFTGGGFLVICAAYAISAMLRLCRKTRHHLAES